MAAAYKPLVERLKPQLLTLLPRAPAQPRTVILTVSCACVTVVRLVVSLQSIPCCLQHVFPPEGLRRPDTGFRCLELPHPKTPGLSNGVTLCLVPSHQILARRAGEMPDLLTELRPHLESCLRHHDAAVQRACLQLLAALLPREAAAVAGGPCTAAWCAVSVAPRACTSDIAALHLSGYDPTAQATKQPHVHHECFQAEFEGRTFLV